MAVNKDLIIIITLREINDKLIEELTIDFSKLTKDEIRAFF